MNDASLIDSSVRDAVISSVAYGRVDDVRAALDAGFPISAAKSDTGFTILHQAVLFGHVPVAILALERGADPNARCVKQVTPLWFAAYSGKAELLRLLIGAGGDVNARQKDGLTPLHALSTHKVEVSVSSYICTPSLPAARPSTPAPRPHPHDAANAS